jgi:hypothetical protein
MTEMLLILVGATALAGLLYWRWARKTAADIAESASLEWERLKVSDPALLEGLDEARFRAVYRRVHFPRFPKYALAIAAAFIIALPVTLSILAGIAMALDSLGMSANAGAIAHSIPIEGSIAGVSRDQGETIALYYIQDVSRFYYYFGLLFVWLAIVFVAMRRFHKRRPGYLREELMDEKAKG